MNKIRRIDVKVTQEQFETLNRKAAENHMNLSEYMLFCGMNAQISVTIGVDYTFNRFDHEMRFIVMMKERGEITDDEFNRLKAALIEKYTKIDG